MPVDGALEDGSVVGTDVGSVVGMLLTVGVSVDGSPVGENDVGLVVGGLEVGFSLGGAADGVRVGGRLDGEKEDDFVGKMVG